MSRLPDHAFRYEHTDIPEGMTIREWRRQRAGQRQSRSDGSDVRSSAARSRWASVGTALRQCHVASRQRVRDLAYPRSRIGSFRRQAS